jgi:hypothetical protein
MIYKPYAVFGYAMVLANANAGEIKENNMKTIKLRQTIKEEIKQILQEAETNLNPKNTTIQGSFKPDLFQKLI